jgi:hypothetical protein
MPMGMCFFDPAPSPQDQAVKETKQKLELTLLYESAQSSSTHGCVNLSRTPDDFQMSKFIPEELKEIFLSLK